MDFNEYIVKTWGDEYPHLAENEYFCLKAVEKTGVTIPNIKLSYNKRFLLVEKFTYDKQKKEYLGFEEVLGLMGKNRDKKYSGSYEQVAKVIYTVTTNKEKSMADFFKTVVMNFLLKNGDAHLKNFAILYDATFRNIYFSPSYDVVNTVSYIFRDKPALTLFGKKLWWGREELIRFGVAHCFLSQSMATKYFRQCIHALEESIKELKVYIKSNQDFEAVAGRMIDSWEFSLNEQTCKELPIEIIRHWTES